MFSMKICVPIVITSIVIKIKIQFQCMFPHLYLLLPIPVALDRKQDEEWWINS